MSSAIRGMSSMMMGTSICLCSSLMGSYPPYLNRNSAAFLSPCMASTANCMRMRVFTSVLALPYAWSAVRPSTLSIGPALTGDARMSWMSSCMSRRSFCLMMLAV